MKKKKKREKQKEKKKGGGGVDQKSTFGPGGGVTLKTSMYWRCLFGNTLIKLVQVDGTLLYTLPLDWELEVWLQLVLHQPSKVAQVYPDRVDGIQNPENILGVPQLELKA